MKYYKITNKNEIHNDMHYKTGINRDIKEFFPGGDCARGGMYFSREDILGFLYSGCWIREVTLLPESRVYENPGAPKKWKTDVFCLGERKPINLETIKYLVNQGANIHAWNDTPLRWAARYGHIDVVRYLVGQGADIHAEDDDALFDAARYGHIDVVKYLVEQGANVHARCEYALFGAANYGRTDVVKYLVEQGADIHADDDDALRCASRNGHTDVVKYLETCGGGIQ
jgi:hypothetical protein